MRKSSEFLLPAHETAALNTFPEDAYILARDGAQEVYDLSQVDFGSNSENWLRAVAELVTSGCASDLDIGLRWTTWLQQVTCHSCYPPVDEENQMVFHPKVLLSDRRMHCGQSARLVVDGLIALGGRARLLQLNGHVAAEFYSGDGWVYADADILGGGEFVRDESGQPVGVNEIIDAPEILGFNNPYSRKSCWTVKRDRGGVKAGKFSTIDQDLQRATSGTERGVARWAEVFERREFEVRELRLATPYVIQKKAQASGLRDRYYGWGDYECVPRN